MKRLFAWLRPGLRDGTEARSAPRRWGWLAGRRVLANTPYVLPKDKSEGDRLDLQHHLFKLAAGGNYRAPIRQPRAILDVACGTGIWGREMAQKFKRARVVGFDIDRTPLERSLELLGPNGLFPPNFKFITADALKPFPFEDEEFDFVHARMISPFVPVAKWPQVVAEMVRVTRRGGYVELVDFSEGQTPSPAGTRLWKLAFQVFERAGLHRGAAPYLAEYLRQAGLQRVQQRAIIGGVGRQAERQQRLVIADFLSVAANMEGMVLKLGLVSKEEYQALLAQAKEELPRAGLQVPFVFAFGIKL